jgi:hypothetical protein
MASDVQASSDTSVTGLVTGIIHDVQELFKQQVALLKHEVREDVRRTGIAAAVLAGGAGVLSLGILLLCFMVVHLLSWAFYPDLPLWISYLIVGGVFTLAGAALLYAGKKKLDSFNPLPDESAEALKENVQWIVKPK